MLDQILKFKLTEISFRRFTLRIQRYGVTLAKPVENTHLLPIFIARCWQFVNMVGDIRFWTLLDWNCLITSDKQQKID